MANLQYYERVLKTKKPSATRRGKILLICAYALILLSWVVVALVSGLSASLLMLIPMLALTVSVLTWKYTSVEYEYSFAAGIFTFSKIYGKAKRRTVLEGDLRALVSVTPYTERAQNDTHAESITNALTPMECQNPYICVFEENESSYAVILDCDEMTLKIFKFFKPSVYISK